MRVFTESTLFSCTKRVDNLSWALVVGYFSMILSDYDLPPTPQSHILFGGNTFEQRCGRERWAKRLSLRYISWNSKPGHIDGNDVFYHSTTDARIRSDTCGVRTHALADWRLKPAP